MFFRVMPGYAHVLLALADGASKVLESFTHLISPLIKAGLYVHGFFIYAGLAVTGIVALFRWLPVLGEMLVNIGLKSFRMGKLAVEALTSPLGVTALFFAAFVTLAVVIGRTQDATVRWANSLQNAIDNSKSLPEVFTNTVIALSRVTDGMRNFGPSPTPPGRRSTTRVPPFTSASRAFPTRRRNTRNCCRSSRSTTMSWRWNPPGWAR